MELFDVVMILIILLLFAIYLFLINLIRNLKKKYSSNYK